MSLLPNPIVEDPSGPPDEAPATPPEPVLSADGAGPAPAAFWRRGGAILAGFFAFCWEIVAALARMLRATLLLFVNTPPVLLPSVVHTATADEAYQRWLFGRLRKIGGLLPLSTLQRPVLEDNWLAQMQWVERRATRERNANELIRWWQIILGVLIPVFIQVDSPELRLAASIAGVFVAVITAVHQFRRPDERWQHYRLLSERYQMTFWDYVTLAGEDYAGKTHGEAFNAFNTRMNALRRDDVSQFFGEIVPGGAANTDKLTADLRAALARQDLPLRPAESPARA